MLCAEGLGLNVGLGHSLLDQEALDSGNAAFGECLIEGSCSATVRMTLKRKLRIGLCFKVLLEVCREIDEDLLLSGQQTALGVLRARLIGREVDAVESESRFQGLVDRRRRWLLDRNLGRSLSGEAARIGASSVHGDGSGRKSRSIQRC